jgi:hypothetical protein
VDTGNWSDTFSPDAAIKTRALVEAMGEMGYAAVNISERELLSGYETFLEQKKQCKFPIVSANIVFQSTGKSIVAPYTILTLDPRKYKAVKKPFRIAIAGVTRFNPTFLKAAPPSDNVIIANPQDELKKLIPEMRKKADTVIVLAAMPRDDAHVLAKEIAGIDLILGGYAGMVTAVEEKEGNTSIFYLGNQGKYLGELRAFQKEGVSEIKTNLHYLNASYPEDPTMKAKVDAALAEINNLGKTVAAQLAKPVATGSAASSVGEENSPFLTAETCKPCHAAEYTVWAASDHAHAMQTLIDKKADFNPECVGCHVVGFKKKGGFLDRTTTSTLANVQCESCHGPGARHVKNSHAPYGNAGKSSCMPCHTHENSPSFEFESYWARIRHGS